VGCEGGIELEKIRGAGGTSGGIAEFIMGVCMAGLGGYQILSNIRVTSHYSFSWFGYGGGSSSGPLMGVFFLGLFFVFFNGKSSLGWILVLFSISAMIYSVIANLQLYWSSQNLLITLAMFGLLAGGMGMVAKSLTAHE